MSEPNPTQKTNGVSAHYRGKLIFIIFMILAPVVFSLFSTNQDWYSSLGFSYWESLALLLLIPIFLFWYAGKKYYKYFFVFSLISIVLLLVIALPHNNFQNIYVNNIIKNTAIQLKINGSYVNLGDNVTALNLTQSKQFNYTLVLNSSNITNYWNQFGCSIHIVLSDTRNWGYFGMIYGIIAAFLAFLGFQIEVEKNKTEYLTIASFFTITFSLMIFASQSVFSQLIEPIRQIYVVGVSTLLVTIFIILGTLARVGKEQRFHKIISLIIAFGIGFAMGSSALAFLRTPTEWMLLVPNTINDKLLPLNYLYFGSYFLMCVSSIFIGVVLYSITRAGSPFFIDFYHFMDFFQRLNSKIDGQLSKLKSKNTRSDKKN